LRRLSVALDARKLRFACDSPLEEGGFEPSIPGNGEVSWRAESLDVGPGMRHVVRRRGRPRFHLLGGPLHGTARPNSLRRQTRRWRETDSNLYGAFPVKRLFWVVLTVFCSERERPFFVPSPGIRFAERAEGVKGPKR
jgi:hypothetical protein